MYIFIQQIINGLTIGSIFALIALGYTMVYGTMKFINFAHGDLVALSSFVGLTIYMTVLSSISNSLVAILLSLVLTIIIISIVGVLLERIAYRPLRKASRLSAVVSALGAGMIFQNGIMLIWGPNPHYYPADIIPNIIWHFGDSVISLMQVIILLLSFIIMVALYILVNKTRTGRAIRAAAINQDAARLMGINVDAIIIIIFTLGSTLGAIGGLFIGMFYRGITFNIGWNYGISAFVAAIIGGIGNIPGAMLGGLFLGLFNSMISGYISSAWADAFTYILLILILIFKPTGILGERVAEKV